MKFSAACSRCFASTCGNGGGAAGTRAVFFCRRRQSQNARANAVSASSVHQSHPHSLGISTGGLTARNSFVAPADGGGTISADWFVATAILNDVRDVSHG